MERFDDAVDSEVVRLWPTDPPIGAPAPDITSIAVMDAANVMSRGTSLRAMRRTIAGIVACAVTLAACGGNTAADASLDIETKTGYAVIVEQIADQISIGFSTDRDALAGEAYDVAQAIWRVGEGAWNEPPVSCLGRGQRVQLGITMVENVNRPGLLMERVVWLVCLAPE